MFIFTSSPICMMPSSVAMEILCITNIGSISSQKIGVENRCKMSDCNILSKIGRSIRNVLENILFKFKSIDIENSNAEQRNGRK